MGLVNEPRQGMLWASSSWLTCIWHNVPCADRCRVAVWSSGFYHCKGSDMIGVEKLTAWIMKVSLGSVGNILSCYEMWPLYHIFLHSSRAHTVSFFSPRVISKVYHFLFISEEFPRTPNHDSIKSKVITWHAKQNGSEKDKVCSLKIGCCCKGAKKCVMFLTWQMHCLAWWHWVWQCLWLPGHLLGWCVPALMPRVFPIVFP